MKRVVTVFAILLILAMAAPAAAHARRAEAAKDWIVTVMAGVKTRDVAPGLAKQAGGSAGRVFEHALRGFVFHGSARAAEALRRNAAVRTVVPDRPIKIAAETVPPGIKRVRANHPTAPDAQDSGFTGSGARVAVIDTGIDLTHPDLVAGLDSALGTNCMTSGPPQDGHGHGTHVAGTIGARVGNNIGVVGIAPDVRLVPVKVLNNSGEGNWSNVICGIDHVTGLATDADPANDVDVVNMSLGDVGDVGSCQDGGLREAICRSVNAGVVYIAAAGNSFTDASTFIPAAFPEVIAVSAISDFDGERGGSAGCRFIFELFGYYCDDEIAAFSNVGTVVDVAAPGVQVNSTWKGGGYLDSSGTSMAAPHVAGVAALVRAANQSLSPSQVAMVVERSGEYPDGSTSESGCGSSTPWPGDRDDITEPLVNALRAAQTAVGGVVDIPSVTLSPAEGATVSGTVNVAANAGHPNGIASVEFLLDGTSIGTDTTAPFGVAWDSTSTFDGDHALTARATATTGQFGCQTNAITVGAKVQGDWVGTYGADGYALGAWSGTSATSDLVALPNATLTLEQGNRYLWANPTSDVRALESPDQSHRRSGAWFLDGQLKLRLDFSAAYTGTLHLYVLDWDTASRRQNVTVTDGTTSKTIALTSSYYSGAWLHYPIDVPAGGTVRITADYVSGWNAVIQGLFLGGPGVPPMPPPSDIDSPGVQGDWVGTYGADGYALGAWSGTSATSDLVALPNATLTLEQGNRYLWANPTSDVRALESPDQSHRRSGAWFLDGQLKLRLDFSAAYTGTLHLYVLDWDTASRRQNVTVTDGTTSKTIALTSSYYSGAWLHYPIDVPAGGTVRITADYVSGWNAVIQGLFLGGPGVPPMPPPSDIDSPGVQGDWVGTYGADGYALGAWSGTSATSDLVALPNATLTLEQGNRYLWANPTSDVRALESPDQSHRRSGAWFLDGQLKLRLDFSAAYTGTLHLYVLDWDTASRRQNVTVTDGTTSKTIALTSSYYSGAWLHYPIDVPAGGTVRITADWLAGWTANIQGIFLGGSGAPATAPAAPGLTATAGNAQVALSWTAPADGGSPITGYRLYRGTTSGSLSLYQSLGTGTTYTDTAVTNGTTYFYAVSAVNAIGEGSRSAERSATPTAPATAPAAPGLTATAGNAQVALSWTAPADGGSPITGYRLYRGTTSGSLSLYQSLGTGTTYTDTAVTNGTTYFYAVSAVNAIGEGSRSAERSATPTAPATAPAAPGLTATAGNAQVALSWTAPADGGSPITGYRLYRGTTSGSLSLYQSLGTGTTYTDTAVTNGTTYFYAVSAVNAIGEGSRSAERSATPTAPATAPAAPQNVTAAPHATKGINLAWSAPASSGGSPITQYRIYRSTTSGTEVLLTSVNGTTFIHRDSSTRRGVRYYYIIRAVNAIGVGQPSDEVTAVAR